MKQTFIATVLILFVFASSFAQVLLPEIKKSDKINNAKLSQIDTLVNSYVNKHWVNGVSVIVVKDNQVVYHKGIGYADRANKKMMEADAIYRIMSQTKAITSLAIMQLFEQGKLELDQPVSDFISTFKNAKVIKEYNPIDTTYTTVPAKRDITIRDLLTHSAGIDYTDIGSEKMSAIYNKAGVPSGLGYFNTNLLEKMKVLGTLPLTHQPGEKFTYGLNTDILGCIVELVSGESLESYFNKNIFEPLGMKDTYFNVPTSKASRIPTVYTENESNQVIEWSPTFRKINPNYPLIQKSYFSGGAGLSSTAYDYAIFLQMLLNKGKYNGKQIISPRTATLMTSPQLDFKYNKTDDFGLGFSLTSEKSANLHMRNKGSFAWGGYYGTTYWADPVANMIVLIMTQQTPNTHSVLQSKIENIIYGSLKQ